MLEIGAEPKIVSDVRGARQCADPRNGRESDYTIPLASTGLSLAVGYRQLSPANSPCSRQARIRSKKQWVLSRNSRSAWRAGSVAPRCCSNPVCTQIGRPR